MYLQLLDQIDMISKQNEALLEQTKVLSEQNKELADKINDLKENAALSQSARFGRKTEKSREIPGQYAYDFNTMCIINEAEILAAQNGDHEPTIEEVVVKSHVRKKSAGKRKADLSGLPVEDVPAKELSEEELNHLFPNGYHRLEDDVYEVLEMIPAKFIVKRYHTAVYVSVPDKDGNTEFARGPRPGKLFGSNSITSPTLLAGLINGKYGNANPLNRMAGAFLQKDVRISPQDMAGWMIKSANRYFKPLFELMHQEMLRNSQLIHSDESYFKVTEQMKVRGKNAKAFMWLYHTDTKYGSHPIFLYEYCPSRDGYYPEAFLRDYHGILMTDGYEAYHKLGRDHPDQFTIAGCWAHCKRKFVELIKAVSSYRAKGTVPYECNARIEAIYHVDNMYKDLAADERKDMRQQNVKPLVDAFFVYLKNISHALDNSGAVKRAVNYALNQEQYLREFLNNGIIPLDNNEAERSIRAFCVNRANWHIINSDAGSAASGILLSMTETAKANGLKVFEYLAYVMQSMIDEAERHHQKANQRVWGVDFLETLLPWSPSLPDTCRMIKTK